MAVLIKEREIRNLIKSTVVESVQAVLNDPDFGLELSSQAKKRLHSISNSRKKNISFEQIKKKYS